MKRESVFFGLIFTIIFLPIVAMLILTGTAMAETAGTPIQTSTPEEPRPTPLPMPTPAPLPDISEDNFINIEYTLPMKAGESRTIRVLLAADRSEETKYWLEPDMIISEADDINLFPNDDWVYCTDEWDKLVLAAGSQKEIVFDILPPEGTPEGHYEFSYRIIKDFKEQLPTGMDIHDDPATLLRKANTRFVTIVVNITP